MLVLWSRRYWEHGILLEATKRAGSTPYAWSHPGKYTGFLVCIETAVLCAGEEKGPQGSHSPTFPITPHLHPHRTCLECKCPDKGAGRIREPGEIAQWMFLVQLFPIRLRRRITWGSRLMEEFECPPPQVTLTQTAQHRLIHPMAFGNHSFKKWWPLAILGSLQDAPLGSDPGAVLSCRIATSHAWPLSPWNVARMTCDVLWR